MVTLVRQLTRRIAGFSPGVLLAPFCEAMCSGTIDISNNATCWANSLLLHAQRCRATGHKPATQPFLLHIFMTPCLLNSSLRVALRLFRTNLTLSVNNILSVLIRPKQKLLAHLLYRRPDAKLSSCLPSALAPLYAPISLTSFGTLCFSVAFAFPPFHLRVTLFGAQTSRSTVTNLLPIPSVSVGIRILLGVVL